MTDKPIVATLAEIGETRLDHRATCNPMTSAYAAVAGDRVIAKVAITQANSRATTVRASVWAFTPDGIMAASGAAGGGGYHKASAAFSEACRNAGITFDQGIAGRGEWAIRESLEAIARAISGDRKVTIVAF